METKNDLRTVKGFFLIARLKLLEEKIGPQGLEKLEKEYGALKFQAFGEYPILDLVKIDDICCRLLFGDNSLKHIFEFGKLVFHLYAETTIAKTYFSLLKKDIERLALEIPKLYDTVFTGLKVEIEKLGEKHFRLILRDDPWNPEMWRGFYTKAIEFFGHKVVEVSAREVDEEDHEFVARWE